MNGIFFLNRSISFSVSVLLVFMILFLQFIFFVFAPYLGLLILIVIPCCFIFFARNYNLFLIYFLLLIIFQNFFISLLSAFIPNETEFKLLHASNFLSPFIVVFFLLYRKLFRINDRRLFRNSLFIIVILIAYTIYGLSTSNISSVAVNFRLFSTAIFLLWAGYLISEKTSEVILTKTALAILLISISAALIEMVVPNLFYTLINASSYYTLKYPERLGFEPFYTSSDVVNKNVVNFLNYFHEFVIIRTGSIINNTISFAYVICVFSVYYYFLTDKLRYLFIGWVAILILTSAKGPLFAITFFILISLVTRQRKVFFGLFLLILIPFYGLVIFLGFVTMNEHIMGFASGINNLIQTPFGQGLGSSGNLIEERLAGFSDGRESAFGVLLTSLGLMGLIYLYCNMRLFYIMSHHSKHYIITLLSLTIFFQGIFQEEAFSPYALGLVLLISGFYYQKEKMLIPKNL